MGTKKKTSSAFERMINEIMNENNGGRMLEECMAFDVKLAKKVPLRYRIIALGFVKKLTLDELNEKLKEEGCAQLYSRSFWEASLIFAFLNRMSYREWKELQEECTAIREVQDLDGDYFKENVITFQELRRYLEENSTQDQQMIRTRHLTRVMEKKIQEVSGSKEDFIGFLTRNVASFSVVREKTRYYFCKYLFYDLNARIERYADACRTGTRADGGLADLAVFKGVSQLHRKKMTPEQSRELLEQVGISCGEIFDAFNYFYFEYVSLDWMEVLIEYYGNMNSLPLHQKKKLASSLRHYNPEYGKLTDAEILTKKQMELDDRERELDQIYSLGGNGRGYQRNRVGENTIRKFIKGTLDIDRSTLICFLLFFSSDAGLPAELAVTRGRLGEILLECGFSSLNETDDFDDFVIQYLEADDPVEFLMDEVTGYAMQEENFYLYRMYQASKSYDQEFQKVMGIK